MYEILSGSSNQLALALSRSFSWMSSSLPSSASISSSLKRLRTGTLYPPVDLIWTSHPSWPFSDSNSNANSGKQKLRISVLDSSFNPPTLAHFALANAAAPVLFDSDDSSCEDTDGNSNQSRSIDYDAKLLLLSVRNADKQLKPTDATYVQRVEMIIEFAKDLQDARNADVGRSVRDDVDANRNVGDERTGDDMDPGIAVAIIDEPTFVGKSRMLQDFFRKRFQVGLPDPGKSEPSASTTRTLPSSSTVPTIQLTFLLGYDTLERLFALRYYDNLEENMYQALQGFFGLPTLTSNTNKVGDGSVVVCARRSPSSYPHSSLPPPNTSTTRSASTNSDLDSSNEASQSLTKTISSFLESSSLPASSITMIDIGEDAWKISSSEVREGVKRNSTGKDNAGQSKVVASGEWNSMVSERVRRYIVEHGLYL
ncbi:hypothetical protein GYMLUDRAFT_37790 [Collybiopsis luxurians FD-317 M1]|nr:hypothetical protein GYMLUDRAFT_37790 [Collybiopsis luxurians FD-317 M1]